MNHPYGIALDTCGNIFISDAENNRVREIIFTKCHYLQVENENKSNSNISIYPNPTYDLLHIDNLKTPSTYRLLSIVGAVVQQGNLKEGNNSISVAAIPGGVYVIEVLGEERGERMISKIVKE